MDVVTEWLAPTILSELAEAIRWKRQCLDGDAPLQTKNSTAYEDDGSNLRVRCSTVGVVQIIKFLSCEEPVRFVISDRSTRIDASIPATTTQKFMREERQRFTEDRVGGLIQIRAFEIVATHLGPRSQRLTLLIKDFECLGSDGSAACGMPRAIESVDNEKDQLLDQLDTTRKKEKSSAIPIATLRQDFADTAAPHRKYRELLMPDQPDLPATQVEFATQAPRVSLSGLSLQRPKNRSTDDPGRFSAHQDSNGVQFAQLNDRSKTQEQVARTGLNPNLRSLENKNFVNRRPPQGYDRSALMHILAGKPQLQTASGSRVSGSESSKQNEVVSKDLEARVRANALKAHGAEESSTVAEITPRSRHSSESNRTANLSTVKSHTSSQVAKDAPSADEKGAYKTVSTTQVSNWRISTRDVRIPKDQEAVLSRADSWLPADPGYRNPAANIPTGTLQTFNRGADEWKQKSSVNHKDTEVGISGDSDSDSDESSQPDSESSSNSYYKWSPSPERDSLPPDSSAPATDQSEEEVNTAARGSLKAAGQNVRHSSRPNSVADSVKPYQKPLQTSLSSDIHASSPIIRSPQSFRGLRTQDPELHGNNRLGSSPPEGNSQQIQSQRCASDPLPIPAIDRSPSSQSDSDIELVVPVALKGSPEPRINKSAPILLTSSASQPEPPFTQVKNTPYSDGNARAQHHSRDATQLQTSGNRAQITSPPPSSSLAKALSQSPIDVHANSEHAGLAAGKRKTPLSESVEGEAQAGISEIVFLSQAAQPVMKNQNGIEAHCFSEQTSPISPLAAPSTLKGPHVRSHSKSEALSPAHKRPGSSLLGPAQTKRLRKRALPTAFKMSQLPDDLPDPAISARQHRQNWFAAQKTSESSISKEGLPPIVEDVPLPRPDRTHRLDREADLPTTPERCNREDNSISKVPLNTGTLGSEKVSHLSDFGSGKQAIFNTTLMNMRKSSESFKPIISKQISTTSQGDSIEGTKSINVMKGQYGENLQTHSYIYKTNNIGIQTTIETNKDPVPLRRFQTFKAAYADYNGDFDHFVSLCRKLSKLHNSKRQLHRSLWDDFVVRHSNDYRDYLFQCHQTAEDPISYERFYHDVIEEPIFTKRVLRVEDIRDASEFNVPVHTFSTTQINASIPRTQLSTSMNVFQDEDAPSKVSGRLSPAQITIDLTDDDPEALGLPNGLKMPQSNSCSQGQKRSLPWADPRNHKHSASVFQQKEKLRSEHERIRQAGRSSTQPTGQSMSTRSANVAPRSITPIPDTRMQVADGKLIEAVRQVPENSRNLASPHQRRHWWHDEDTPFKIFSRNYAAVKPGNGNSFAKAATIPCNDKVSRLESRALGDLDVLNWTL